MLNKKQKEFYEMAIRGENLFITGSAGTGKTFLINEIEKYYKGKGKKVVKCAPTGLAARTIGGYTLHHQFHINTVNDKVRENGKNNINNWLKSTDLLIIDEISMVSFHLLNTIGNQIRKHNDKCQVIVLGDFFQLPPVITENTKKIIQSRGYSDNINSYFAFHSKYWREKDFKVCELTETMRQSDKNFSSALYNLSRGTMTSIDRDFLRQTQLNPYITDDDAITLTCTKKLANEINNNKLKQLTGKLYKFEADYWGLYDTDVEKILYLKIGSKVMMTINDSDGEYCNGDIGYVKEIKDSYITVSLTNGSEVNVEPYEYQSFRLEETGIKKIGSIEQFPLKLAWALTVHKSQGQTFEKVNFLFNTGFFPNAPENLTLLYVGLSRVKKIENLHLEIEIPVPSFVNQEINSFYKGIYETYKRAWDTETETVGF